jgi:arylsulfatase A-like enzyme
VSFSRLIPLLLVFLTAIRSHAQPTPKRPNILFAIADDWSFGHAGAYGCKWVKTPAFDRVANSGVLFSRAYTPNAKCAPSRACILTGRNSWQLGAGCNHECYFPPEYKTYVEALAEHGYTVGSTAKGWAPGVALDADGHPRQMAGRPFNKRTAKPPTTGIGRNDYAANFADFLDAAPADKPWCFWYGAVEPHRAYEYGSGAAKGGKKISDVDRVPAYWPDNPTVREDLLDYAYEVEHFDEHLGRMLDLLQKKGLLENTLVVVTSDNGMPFPRVKGQEYEFSNHLPLAMMWPAGIKHTGRTIEDYVSFIDLAPTFVELTGLTWDQTGMAPSAGRSLVPLLESDRSGTLDPTRDHVLIGKERHDVGRPHNQGYPIRGIIKNQQIYLENFEPTRWPAGNPETGYLNCDGGATKTLVIQARNDPANRRFWELAFGRRPAEEFYDLKSDPDCMYNLAGNSDKAKEKDALKEQLTAELTAQQDPRMFGKGEIFEQFPYANDKVRGFYERFMKGEPLKAGWVNKTDFDKLGDAPKQP